METKRKILFAVPTLGTIRAETTFAIAGMCQRDDVHYIQITGWPIDHVRNQLAYKVLCDPSYTHLLMMDSDIQPPADIVDLLLECDSNLASGIYPIISNGRIVACLQRNDQYNEPQFLRSIDRSKGPFEVDNAGTGIVLIRREVFEKVPWPWFKFQFHNGPQMGITGEDIYFGKKAARYGYKYKVHPKAMCGHHKNVNLLDVVNLYSPEQGETPCQP